MDKKKFSQPHQIPLSGYFSNKIEEEQIEKN